MPPLISMPWRGIRTAGRSASPGRRQASWPRSWTGPGTRPSPQRCVRSRCRARPPVCIVSAGDRAVVRRHAGPGRSRCRGLPRLRHRQRGRTDPTPRGGEPPARRPVLDDHLRELKVTSVKLVYEVGTALNWDWGRGPGALPTRRVQIGGRGGATVPRRRPDRRACLHAGGVLRHRGDRPPRRAATCVVGGLPPARGR